MITYLSIPGVLIYVFIIPTLIYWKIKKERNLIHKYDHKNDVSKRELIEIEDYYVKYGFLYCGNNPGQENDEFR
jgi:uncharacterized membrane protein